MAMLLGLASLPLVAAFAVVAARAPFVVVAVFAFLIPLGSGIDAPLGLPGGFASTSAMGLALAALSLHLVFARRRAADLPRAAPVWLLLLAVSLLTYLWSVNPDQSYEELLALTSLVVLYLACTLAAVERRGVALLEAAIAAGGAVTGLVAVYQVATSTIALSAGDIPRFRMGVGGEGGDPNITAATLVLPLVVAIGRGIRGGGRLTGPLYLAAAVLTALAIILTASRGSAIAAIVAIAVLVVNDSRGKVIPRGKVIAICAVLVLAIATALTVAPGASTSRFTEGGTTGRSDVWRVGATACWQYCWTGSGWGTFPDVYERQVISSPSGKGNELRYRAHNMLLAMAIEAGLVTLVLAVLGFALTASDLFRIPPALRGPPLAGLVGLFVSNMFVANFSYKYFWLAIVYATVAAVDGRRRTHAGGPTAVPRYAPR